MFFCVLVCVNYERKLYAIDAFLTIVAERIVINLGVAGSKSANSLVQKYGKLEALIVFSLCPSFIPCGPKYILHAYTR
jgi:hypothetical protein